MKISDTSFLGLLASLARRSCGSPSEAPKRDAVPTRIASRRVIHRREEVRRRHRVVTRVRGALVALAVNLSAANAAPGEQRRLTRAPVIAPAVLVHLRRAPELARRRDQRAVEQPAINQVFDE